MNATSLETKTFLRRLKNARKKAGITPEVLEEQLILGPGWIEKVESGESVPDLDTLFVLINHIEADPMELFAGLQNNSTKRELNRLIRGVEDGDDLNIHFKYASYDAEYKLKGANLAQFEEVIKTLRDGLAKLAAEEQPDEKQVKTQAVATAFSRAISLWPKANPSDLWWFIIYRAYCDPFNHPAKDARMSFEQSWKRTGGWALEEILVHHYNDELKKSNISIEIAHGERKRELLDQFNVDSRLESDKVDIFVLGPSDQCFGVINVKASFAERRTDDVPMSQALIKAGYFSPLWTMDCKSTPSAHPFNKGELGSTEGKRSAKRKDIEDDGWFSACFSYNKNTQPTPPESKAKAKVIVCDFSDPADEFVKTVIQAWDRYQLDID